MAEVEAELSGLKYKPTTEDSDPIVQALKGVLGAKRVESELEAMTRLIPYSHSASRKPGMDCTAFPDLRMTILQ